MEEYYYSDLSGKIIVIFYDIYNNVGWGYRENFYERLARTRLYENGIKYKDQFTFPLLYNKTVVKLDRPDLLIEDKIILFPGMEICLRWRNENNRSCKKIYSKRVRKTNCFI